MRWRPGDGNAAAVAQRTHQQRQTDHAVRDDHDHREHGVTSERRIVLAAEHQRRDHHDFDGDHR